MVQRVAPQRSRGSGRRGGSLRRSREWFGVASTANAGQSAGTQSTLVIVQPSIDLTANDGTVVRIVGDFLLRCSAAALDAFYRLGIIVVDEDARVAGAVPDPWTDPAAWMWERTGWLYTSNVADITQAERFHVDIKTGRKLPQSHSALILVIENLSGSTTGFDYFVGLKALVVKAT